MMAFQTRYFRKFLTRSNTIMIFFFVIQFNDRINFLCASYFLFFGTWSVKKKFQSNTHIRSILKMTFSMSSEMRFSFFFLKKKKWAGSKQSDWTALWNRIFCPYDSEIISWLIAESMIFSCRMVIRLKQGSTHICWRPLFWKFSEKVWLPRHLHWSANFDFKFKGKSETTIQNLVFVRVQHWILLKHRFWFLFNFNQYHLDNI